MRNNDTQIIMAGLVGLVGGIIIADKYRKKHGVSITGKVTKTGEGLMKEMVRDDKKELTPDEVEKKIEEFDKEVEEANKENNEDEQK